MLIFKSYKRTIHHLIYWILVSGLFSLFLVFTGDNLKYSIIKVLMLLPGIIITSYWANSYLLKLLLNKHYKKLLLYTLITIIVSLWLLSLSVISILVVEISTDYAHQYRILDVYMLITGSYLAIILTIAIKMIRIVHSKELERKEADKKKVEMELQALKNQVNPHFLFNTLNSIYALSMEKSSTAPEMVLKLSEILSHLLYECNSDKVTLSSELELINNYIYLEKERFGERLKLTVNNDIKNSHHNIAPVLILPFVENIFKHGVGKKRGDINVNISFSIKNSTFNMKLRNDKPQSKIESNRGGIGIENVSKRLELLYKDRYKLNIENEEKYYAVNIQIEL